MSSLKSLLLLTTVGCFYAKSGDVLVLTIECPYYVHGTNTTIMRNLYLISFSVKILISSPVLLPSPGSSKPAIHSISVGFPPPLPSVKHLEHEDEYSLQ